MTNSIKIILISKCGDCPAYLNLRSPFCCHEERDEAVKVNFNGEIPENCPLTDLNTVICKAKAEYPYSKTYNTNYPDRIASVGFDAGVEAVGKLLKEYATF